MPIKVLRTFSSIIYAMNPDLLFNAIRSQDKANIAIVLKEYPELIQAKDQRGSTPLLLATYYGFKDITEILLYHNADINVQDASGNTALMGVCFKGYPEIAELLIKRGANIDLQNSNNATALIYATTFNQEAIVKLLLAHDADKSLKDARGHTAKDHAQMQELNDILDLLSDES
jgi:hypothetical protein